ncbi:MAG: hypothetical protein V7K27_32050 [Nostoc sp.]|uniref:hypothetical protein n=1 Tax=Nostoc sp. TaxID=1180 RepID=UPI002FF6D07B
MTAGATHHQLRKQDKVQPGERLVNVQKLGVILKDTSDKEKQNNGVNNASLLSL